MMWNVVSSYDVVVANYFCYRTINRAYLPAIL